MRPDPRVLVAAAMFIASPIRGEGRVACTGPGGSPIVDGGWIQPRSALEVAAARATGLAQGYRTVYELPGNWHSLALVHDSTLTWPAHTRIVATCDGREMPCLDLFAMSPPYEQRVIRLGGDWPVILRASESELWRRRFRHGPMATVLFVRFPVDSCRGDITAIRMVEGR